MSEKFNNLLKRIDQLFTQEMEFTKSFQLKVIEFTEAKLKMNFPMLPCLQGNMLQGILHGGAIATVLDSAGGMIVMAANFAKDKEVEYTVEQQAARLARTATVDLRVDYLRPARGSEFFVTAEVIRAGRKINVTRMELFDQKETLLATAIGIYLMGE